MNFFIGSVQKMLSLSVLVFSALFGASSCVKSEFPTWFKFGAATAAYQVEGAWNVSDKAESIWDRYSHMVNNHVIDKTNGDVTCDSYHLWRRDIEMTEELGIQIYRFSISWPRILPTGYSNVISEDGKRYHNDLIDALLEKGIEPFATIYHFDLPVTFQYLGGWTNPSLVQFFASYARVLFTLFGDRVKLWATINEPEVVCDMAYTTGIAPVLNDSKISPYLCTKNVLLAHAKAWRIYDEEFKTLYHGRVSLPIVLTWLSPTSPEDKTLTKLATDFTTGRFTQPIYSKEGGFPASFVKLMREVSTKEGYDISRLPDLTQEEVELIRGTYDFFALNYYACANVRSADSGEIIQTIYIKSISELNAIIEIDPELTSGPAVICPKGLRQQLAWLKRKYGDLEIFITENGMATVVDNLKDDDRIDYIKKHLFQVLYSIYEDKVNVTGYVYWALMDNFQWMEGYTALFGASSSVKTEFPTGFTFGAATAAYQIEGAWNVSDKGESTWDQYTHMDPSPIADMSNGDVACDSYNHWKQDVNIAKELRIQTYRFSISWSRVLPVGYSDVVSEDGKRYYNDLIDHLLEKGIEPFPTIFHYDLPQTLQNIGGWTNPLMVDIFANYARVLFKLFADRVKYWTTINEPEMLCDLAYTTGDFVPGYVDSQMAPYLCTKHVLLAHAKAWRIYDSEYKPLFHGKVSIPLNLVWLSPTSRRDKAITELATDFTTGRFTQPIYSKEGGFPNSIVKLMKDVSNQEGYEVSRLPDLSQEEVEYIRGTYDFFGLNYYECVNVRRAKDEENVTTIYNKGISELNAVMEFDPKLQSGPAVNCPNGLRQQMAWLKKNYGDLEIIITANGMASFSKNLTDDDRVDYIYKHLKQVLYSIYHDKVNVTGYVYSTLMDSFQWTDGYLTNDGLFEVDFESVKRTRTMRDSAKYYKNVILHRKLRAKYYKPLWESLLLFFITYFI